MDLKLKGKIAMVAASSKGIGFGIALELAKEGTKLSIGSRTESDILEAGKRIENETGTEVLASVLDSSDANSIKNWIDLSLDHFGGIDCLVVNAGGPPPGVFENFSDNDWQSAFDLNLMSAVRMIRGVIPTMRQRGGGSIITITSSSVKEPIDILILSNVMRSGTTSLVKTLSIQLA
ncbi:MAG TPA: SDR family NAD(P)-dependent oxidoreductase, partial [Gammaproteobacteria bacterium]|nr:SDR family NAD(P)-dependent oxidoreductase [Gammaproteobacteria bacterium]